MGRFAALMYHCLAENPQHCYSLPPMQFCRHLQWLTDHRFVVEGFAGLAARLQAGDPLPPHYAILTFDDGHQSSLEEANLVRAAGHQATFFITPKFTSNRHYLSPPQVRELAGLCSVGSHGMTHRMLTKLSDDEVRAELADSKAWLEDVIGAPVTTFSAPGGFINARIRWIALGVGYRLLGSSTPWWNTPAEVSRSHVVNRMGIRREHTPGEIVSMLTCSALYHTRQRVRSGMLAPAKRLMPEQAIRQVRRAARQLTG